MRPEHVGRRPVRYAVAPPAALESQRPRIAEEPDGQSGGDAADTILVARKPGERADRSRPEHEAPCQAGTLLQELARKHGRRANARQVVVGQRWVAGVRVDDGFLGGRARYDALGIRQAAGGQRGIDHHVERTRPEIGAIPMPQAEAPMLAVVTRTIGNPVRPLREGIQMGLDLLAGHPAINGHGVAHHVQAVGTEVHDPPALVVRDVGVPYVPFARHFPVEDPRAGGNFRAIEGNPFPNQIQSLPHAIAGDAAANGVERFEQGPQSPRLLRRPRFRPEAR